MEWQPIETADKHGDSIDIFARGERYTNCFWGKETYGDRVGWLHEGSHDCDGPVDEFIVGATHWMPLPLPPTNSTGG